MRPRFIPIVVAITLTVMLSMPAWNTAHAQVVTERDQAGNPATAVFEATLYGAMDETDVTFDLSLLKASF